MSAKIFEFVATIQCSAVIAATDETTARQCVETWERAWFETGEIVGVVDVDLTDVRPAPRTKEVQEDVAHIVLTKRAGQSEKPCALEADRDALRERCGKLEAALVEIGGSEDRICGYCEGEGNRYADGKAHYYSEHAPTIPCPECGGRGRIRDMDSEDMAAVANAALATEVKP